MSQMYFQITIINVFKHLKSYSKQATYKFIPRKNMVAKALANSQEQNRQVSKLYLLICISNFHRVSITKTT